MTPRLRIGMTLVILLSCLPLRADDFQDSLTKIRQLFIDNAPASEIDEAVQELTGKSILQRAGIRILRSGEQNGACFLALMDGLGHFDGEVRNGIFELLQAEIALNSQGPARGEIQAKLEALLADKTAGSQAAKLFAKAAEPTEILRVIQTPTTPLFVARTVYDEADAEKKIKESASQLAPFLMKHSDAALRERGRVLALRSGQPTLQIQAVSAILQSNNAKEMQQLRAQMAAIGRENLAWNADLFIQILAQAEKLDLKTHYFLNPPLLTFAVEDRARVKTSLIALAQKAGISETAKKLAEAAVANLDSGVERLQHLFAKTELTPSEWKLALAGIGEGDRSPLSTENGRKRTIDALLPFLGHANPAVVTAAMDTLAEKLEWDRASRAYLMPHQIKFLVEASALNMERKGPFAYAVVRGAPRGGRPLIGNGYALPFDGQGEWSAPHAESVHALKDTLRAPEAPAEDRTSARDSLMKIQFPDADTVSAILDTPLQPSATADERTRLEKKMVDTALTDYRGGGESARKWLAQRQNFGPATLDHWRNKLGSARERDSGMETLLAAAKPDPALIPAPATVSNEAPVPSPVR